MNNHFEEYFHEFSEDLPSGNFHRVVALHDIPDMSFSDIKKIVPTLTKGWFELARLKPEERIEFIQAFWESKMKDFPEFCEFIVSFFSGVSDVGVYLIQAKFDDPYVPQIVYKLSGDAGFFRGFSPATDDEIDLLNNAFLEHIFPADYLAFLRIHNGFVKTTDCTGLTKIQNMYSSYEQFQSYFEKDEILYTESKIPINPKKLIPFYKSFGMPYYQCFWAEWYPEQEMGNVYFTLKTKTVSDIDIEDKSYESLSFPTFCDWLSFYLERFDI